MYILSKPVASGGAGGALAPPVFGQTVNPISTRGADYAHHSNTSPPRIFRPCDGPAISCGQKRRSFDPPYLSSLFLTPNQPLLVMTFL